MYFLGESRLAGRHTCLALLATLASATAGAQAAEPKSRIRYAEPLAISVGKLPHSAKLQPDAPTSLELEAFGRRLVLELESNDRLLRRLPASRRAQLPTHDLYRGRIAGLPGSWVRLTRLPDGLYGAIWDGSEIYSIVPAHAAAEFMAGTPPPTSDQPLIYRASDVDLLVGPGFCTVIDPAGRASGPATGLDQYKALLRELPRQATTAAAVASLELEVAMIGDYEFYTQEIDATGALLSRLNIVDGIFSQQVGVAIVAGELKVFNSSADPFTTANAGTLLEQVGSYRASTPVIAAAGLAHLVTGRDLTGSTVGIAYMAGVCENEIGVSLSERWFDDFTSALIAAHEFGHSFGAPHDGEPGPCEGAPYGFLMWPELLGSSEFSQCSLTRMAPVIDASSCLRARQYVDVAVEMSTVRFEGYTRTPLRVSFEIANVGNLTADSAGVSVALGPGITAAVASVQGGTCSTGAGNVTCQLTSIPAGTRRRIELDFSGTRPGQYFLDVAVVAADDAGSGNDQAGFELNLLPATDASIEAASPSSLTVLSGDEYVISYLLHVDGVQQLDSASVNSVSYNSTFISASAQGGTCTWSGPTASCQFAAIGPGATRRVTMRLRGDRAGQDLLQHQLIGSGDDSTNDNYATHEIRINPQVDLVIRAEPGPGIVSLGQDLVRSFTVLSVGPRAAQDANVIVEVGPQFEITAIVTEDANCTANSSTRHVCLFNGAIESGGTRRVRVDLRANHLGIAMVSARVFSPENQHFDGPYSTDTFSWIDVRNLVDVHLQAPAFSVGYDAKPMHLRADLVSLGSSPAAGASVELRLVEGIAALSASANPGNCLIDVSKVRCDLGTIGVDQVVSLDIELQAARPGSFALTLAASAPDDAEPGNDTQPIDMTVLPNIDVAVSFAPPETTLRMGAATELQFEIRTASQPVDAVTIDVNSFQTEVLSLTGVTVPQGSCTVTESSAHCELGTVQANSSLVIGLGIVGNGPGNAYLRVNARAASDVDGSNEWGDSLITVFGPGNASVGLSAPSLRTTVGSVFDHPSIVVSSNGEVGSASLRIEVPTALAVQTATSTIGSCNANAGIVTCEFGTVPYNFLAQVDLRLRADQVGSFTTRIQASATEDSDSSDSSRDVTIVVGDTQSPTGGGGGGSIDWTSLMFGAAALAMRRRRRPQTSTDHAGQVHSGRCPDGSGYC